MGMKCRGSPLMHCISRLARTRWLGAPVRAKLRRCDNWPVQYFQLALAWPRTYIRNSDEGTSVTTGKASIQDRKLARYVRTHRYSPAQKIFLYGDAKRSKDKNQVQELNYKNKSDREMTRQGELIARRKICAYIALGSNVGDRIETIEEALRLMNQNGIRVMRTSPLYETKPMYLTDQGEFLNGVCEIATMFEPLELLSRLQEIERKLGRIRKVENGPRTIDLDILLYGFMILKHKDLTIPHERMLEREFVLRPLCNLIPRYRPPMHDALLFTEYLRKIKSDASPRTITPITRISREGCPPIVGVSATRHTQVMAILNITPDSFSDGGVHSPTQPESLIKTIEKFLNEGANIIDVGGQSTRPGAEPIGEDEELSRILPAIRLIRSAGTAGKNICISVDTYRAKVAEEAIRAGADMVNDVSAGTLDPEMLRTVARLGITYIMGHTRGTPENMQKHAHYPNGVLTSVRTELIERMNAAEAAGIPRWRLLEDPGIGFAKGETDNLEILRGFGTGRNITGIPMVIGVSRKGFIGRITGVKDPKERGWGTAAAVAAAVHLGAEVVRVHDVREMVEVVKVADAIWRKQPESSSAKQ